MHSSSARRRIGHALLLLTIGSDHHAFLDAVVLSGGRVNHVSDREVGDGEAMRPAVVRVANRIPLGGIKSLDLHMPQAYEGGGHDALVSRDGPRTAPCPEVDVYARP